MMDFLTKKPMQLYSLILLMGCVFFGLLLRNQGLFPVVFADEYLYSKFSRLLPLSSSPIPDYLYLIIYRITNVCGDGFLGCARILNAFFYVMAAPFIYLVARKVCDRKAALLIAALSLVGPINTYTAYFMPEALYYSSFWVFTWLILSLKVDSGVKAWCLCGVVLGLTALIKPHALFILPAIMAYVILLDRKSWQFWKEKAFLNFIFLVSSALATKLVVGYLLAGTRGITLFGDTYGSVAESAASRLGHYVELLRLSSESIWGHLIAICLLFGLPISLAICTTFDALRGRIGAEGSRKVSLYTILTLSNLIAVVGIFTATVANAGPYESVARLHMRYYNFAFPLLAIVAASQFSNFQLRESWRRRVIVGLTVAAVIIYALITRMRPFLPSYVDSPELRGITHKVATFYFVGGLSLLLTFFWMIRPKLSAKLFVYLYIPVMVILSSYSVNKELRYRLTANVFDRAGFFVQQYLPSNERARVLIVGSNLGGMFQSLFYLDNPGAALEEIPEGAAFDLTKLPADKEWVLTVGNHPAPENAAYALELNGFSLVKATGSDEIDFREFAWPGVISHTFGLSSAEKWGAWSDSSEVSIEFTIPLPTHFRLHLKAMAFGLNAGSDIEVIVGEGESIRFMPKPTVEEYVLELENPHKSKVIHFLIPHPTAPKSLGLNDDERTLGLGFVKLRIEPLLGG